MINVSQSSRCDKWILINEYQYLNSIVSNNLSRHQMHPSIIKMAERACIESGIELKCFSKSRQKLSSSFVTKHYFM